MPAPRSPVTRLEVARRALNWTQEELADRAGVSAQVIGRAERGHLPTLTVAQRLSAALGRTVDDIFTPPDARPRLATPADVDAPAVTPRDRPTTRVV